MVDFTQPKWICAKCGRIEYVQTGGSDNPKRAKRRLIRRHGGCNSKLRYEAGRGGIHGRA